MPFEPRTHEPIVDPTQALELARDLVVIPNRSVELVPNIRVIGGDHAVPVVETVLAAAFGAMAFASRAGSGCFRTRMRDAVAGNGRRTSDGLTAQAR